MTLEEYSKELENFHTQNNEKINDIWTLLEEVKLFFYNNFEKIDDKEFNFVHLRGKDYTEKKRNFKKKLQSVTEQLENAIFEMVKGNSGKAIQSFYEILFDRDGKCKVKTFNINANASFYRMRSAEKYNTFSREEMFHIPFDMLSRVGSLRFNKAGFPCLYLASSLYIAWEELRRPSFSEVNFALFKNIRPLKLLDLTISHKCDSYSKFLMAFLALLSCTNVKDDKKSFKFEYLVSNIILDVLILNNHKGGCLDGIRYISSKQFACDDMHFQHDRSIMYAYVFPIKDVSRIGYSDYLRKLFKVTNGYTHFLYKIHQLNFNKYTAWTTDYKKSLFYNLEQQLQKEKAMRISKK